jgi:hypothetical protein
MPSENVKNCVGERVGDGFKMCGGMCGKLEVGNCFRKVHTDKFGWGRKFSGHATLFLMVPKS